MNEKTYEILKDKWVVSYSLEQAFFAKDKLITIIKKNQQRIARNEKIKNDYTMIGIFDTSEECDEFIYKWKEQGYAHNYKSLDELLK